MIILRGSQPKHLRWDEVRAVVTATIAVLGYHDRSPQLPLIVLFKTMKDDAIWASNQIHARSDLERPVLIRALIRATVLAAIKFPPGKTERGVEAVVDRIRGDVERLTAILRKGAKGRAAELERTKPRDAWSAEPGDDADDAWDDDAWDDGDDTEPVEESAGALKPATALEPNPEPQSGLLGRVRRRRAEA